MRPVVVEHAAVGGAAGNMICVHNVVAASATVGLVNREGDLIRMALLPMASLAQSLPQAARPGAAI